MLADYLNETGSWVVRGGSTSILALLPTFRAALERAYQLSQNGEAVTGMSRPDGSSRITAPELLGLFDELRELV